MSQLDTILRNQIDNAEMYGDAERIREWQSRADK